MNNTIIGVGNSYRIYDSEVSTYDQLPPATYRVEFSPMSGYSLRKTEPLTSNGEKVYGTHEKRLEKIIRTYLDVERSLGVLLSGDKGMGKSLMVRLIAERAVQEGIPVILVDNNTPEIADFLDTLGEAVIVFDEFEKKFIKTNSRRGEDNEDGQAQFLSLFDGISTQKRMYVVTVNELSDLNSYFVNRPGRFHYHIRFDYPTDLEAYSYLKDSAPNASETEIKTTVEFASRAKINYDHLRAIAFELERGSTFEDALPDLNIKQMGDDRYRARIVFEDGLVLTDTLSINVFNPDSDEEIYITHPSHGSGFLHFEMRDADFYGSDIHIKHFKTPFEDKTKITEFTLTLMKQASYAY